MATFGSTYRSEPILASVAVAVTGIEVADDDMDVHTITLILDGRHGEFNLVVEATQMETMEEHRWEGIAHRTGGVSGFGEVEV